MLEENDPQYTFDQVDPEKYMEDIADEIKDSLNNIVIMYGYELVRLVGVAIDDDDSYYIVQQKDKKNHYYSRVGGFVDLKKYLPEQDYTYVEQMFSLNFGKPVEQMMKEFHGKSFLDGCMEQ